MYVLVQCAIGAGLDRKPTLGYQDVKELIFMQYNVKSHRNRRLVLLDGTQALVHPIESPFSNLYFRILTHLKGSDIRQN